MRHKKNHLLLAGLFFGLALSLLSFGLFASQLTDKVGYLGAYLFILLLLALIAGWGTSRLPTVTNLRDGQWLHAPSLITIWVVLSLGLPGLLGFFNEDEYLTSLKARVGIDWEYFVWGWALVLLGVVCLWVGYALGLRLFSPIGDLARLTKRSISSQTVLLLYGFALTLTFLNVAVVGIGFGADRSGWGIFESFAQVIGYMNNARYIVLALVALHVFQSKWPQKSLVIVLTIEILLAVTTGFMKPMLRLAFIVLAAAYFARVQSVRLSRYVVVFVILGILVVPIAQGLRFGYGTYDNRSLFSVLQAAGGAFERSWGEGVETGSEMFSDKMGGRQASMAHRPGIIIKKTPEIVPYQGLEEFLVIPAYVIPRFLWPGKPVLSKGTWFSVTYMNMSPNTTSSSGFTIFGEPYIYAGWGAVAVALLVYGLMLAFIYKNTVGIGMVAVYIALIPAFIDVDSQFTTRFIGVFQQFVVYLGVYLLLITLSAQKYKRTYLLPDISEVQTRLPVKKL